MCAKSSLLAASIAAAFASNSLASFRISYNLASTSNGFYRWDIVATNTGGATGTQIKAMEFTLRSWSSTGPAFEVNDFTDETGFGEPDGIPDTVNLLSNTRTRIRVSSSGANNIYLGFTPKIEPAQPNPSIGSVTALHGAVANLGTTQATGAGFQIARIYMPAPVSRSPFNGFDFYGFIGGDKGPKVPFNIHSAASIAIDPIGDAHSDFLPTSGATVPFSLDVSVNAVFGAFGDLSLSAFNIPAGVTIDSISGGGQLSSTFTIKGHADRTLIGTTRVVELQAQSSQGGYGTGYFMLVTTPEPTLAAAAASLFMGRSRIRNAQRGEKCGRDEGSARELGTFIGHGI